MYVDRLIAGKAVSICVAPMMWHAGSPDAYMQIE